MSTVNVYEYPKDPKDLPHYRAAVMLAAANGLSVEVASYFDSDWRETSLPLWDWVSGRYRIAAPKIAKGHNPAQLTEDQVGVKDGWRLLGYAEIGDRKITFDIEGWLPSAQRWDNTGWTGSGAATYRTKKPEGYFLKKPEVPLVELDGEAWFRYVESTRDPLVYGIRAAMEAAWNAALKYERSRAK